MFEKVKAMLATDQTASGGSKFYILQEANFGRSQKLMCRRIEFG